MVDRSAVITVNTDHHNYGFTHIFGGTTTTTATVQPAVSCLHRARQHGRPRYTFWTIYLLSSTTHGLVGTPARSRLRQSTWLAQVHAQRHSDGNNGRLATGQRLFLPGRPPIPIARQHIPTHKITSGIVYVDQTIVTAQCSGSFETQRLYW